MKFLCKFQNLLPSRVIKPEIVSSKNNENRRRRVFNIWLKIFDSTHVEFHAVIC